MYGTYNLICMTWLHQSSLLAKRFILTIKLYIVVPPHVSSHICGTVHWYDMSTKLVEVTFVEITNTINFLQQYDSWQKLKAQKFLDSMSM